MLLLCGGAHAQVALDAGLASDNVYRGASLNGHAAAPSLNLAWDGDSGWYADAFASSVRFYRHANSGAQIVTDAGFAHTIASGLTWEAGAIASKFPGAGEYDYAEAFAGLLGERWNARLYFSPDYFGRGRRTLYAQFDYAQPLGMRFRLFGHVGVLKKVSPPPSSSGALLYDAAVGAGFHLDRIDVQLRRVDTSRAGYLYPVTTADARGEWVASVSVGF